MISLGASLSEGLAAGVWREVGRRAIEVGVAQPLRGAPVGERRGAATGKLSAGEETWKKRKNDTTSFTPFMTSRLRFLSITMPSQGERLRAFPT